MPGFRVVDHPAAGRERVQHGELAGRPPVVGEGHDHGGRPVHQPEQLRTRHRLEQPQRLGHPGRPDGAHLDVQRLRGERERVPVAVVAADGEQVRSRGRRRLAAGAHAERDEAHAIAGDPERDPVGRGAAAEEERPLRARGAGEHDPLAARGRGRVEQRIQHDQAGPPAQARAECAGHGVPRDDRPPPAGGADGLADIRGPAPQPVPPRADGRPERCHARDDRLHPCLLRGGVEVLVFAVRPAHEPERRSLAHVARPLSTDPDRPRSGHVPGTVPREVSRADMCFAPNV